MGKAVNTAGLPGHEAFWRLGQRYNRSKCLFRVMQRLFFNLYGKSWAMDISTSCLHLGTSQEEVRPFEWQELDSTATE